jgi:hypothetical protein
MCEKAIIVFLLTLGTPRSQSVLLNKNNFCIFPYLFSLYILIQLNLIINWLCLFRGDLFKHSFTCFFLTDPVRVPMAAICDTTDFFWMPCPGVRYGCISHSEHRHDFNVLRFLPESLRKRQAQLTCLFT